MQRIIDIFFHWLPLGVAITGLTGLIYLNVQQSYRLGLNDPQVSIASDAVNQLSRGVELDSLISASQVDISNNLSPFLNLYDKDGKVVTGNGQYHNQLAQPPVGIFQVAKQRGSYRVTWQPDESTRIALVIMPTTDGSSFVASGRNMREVEMRVGQLGIRTLVCWIIILIASFVVDAIGDIYRRWRMAQMQNKS